ncbi:WD repeat-containing protein GTS1 [Linum grandiflorum]
MMEDAAEMEVEEERPRFSPANPAKRFGLRNSIQTNFGDDYVFQIVPKKDWTSMAVSLSTNAVKLYSPMTGQYLGECSGHSDTINEISFSGSSAPHVLHSCSSDGTLRAWDTRTFQQVSCITAGPAQEVFSFSFGGSDDNLLAAGCKSQVLFWDWRNKRQVACLEDSHMDDVTQYFKQVHFVPGHQNKLLSASMDGLACVFNTGGDINEDDDLDSVINVETSISKVGFFGDKFQKLWCLTHIESLSIWDWEAGRCETNLKEARALASESWTLDNVDYFVDCHYPGEGDNLWVIGGTKAGTIGYFGVNHKEGRIGSPEAILGGGHTDIVRSVLPMMSGGPLVNGGAFGWTGGEDGRLCCWLSDESSMIDRSWTSSALVVKAPKKRKNHRHQPY